MDESQPTASMSVSGGRMTIGGSPDRYLQDVTRRFRLEAAAPRLVGGYVSRDGQLGDARRIEADARIIAGRLCRAGREGADDALGLTLRPFAAAGESSRLLLMLGYRDDDGEAVPFAEAFLPPAVFDDLKAEMLSGRAGGLALAATTSLWIREEDHGLPAAQPVDWYLGPAEDGSGTVPARGFVESIEWRPAAVAEHRAAASAPAPAAMPDPLDPGEPDEETAADQLRRINWSLKQLLLLLAFLLIIVAVK